MKSLSQSDELELLSAIKQGSREAFDELYYRYYHRLRAYVLKFTKDPRYAEDIVQDAFMKVWEVRENLDIDKNFRAYLFTITKNLVLKFFRSAASNEDVLSDVIIHSVSAPSTQQNLVESKELRERIAKAIERLPPKRKEIFLLCKEEELSYKEVSGKLGISHNTIKEHMVLAMKFIRENLQGISVSIYCWIMASGLFL